MKIGRWVFGMVALGLIAVASAKPAPDRLAAIWSFAEERIDRQTDVWFDDGDFPAAIQALRVSSELRPHDYDTVTNLGWMLENIQEWDGAVLVYERYRKDNPNDPDRALPIAQFYYLKKKFDKVPPLLESEVNDKRPPHPNVWRMLAVSYERLGKFADSQRIWKRYVAIAPTDEQAKLNLARVEKKAAAK